MDPKDAQSQGAKTMEKVAHQALSADYFLMSSNAISATGELVNADAAILRVKNYAAQMICLAFRQDYSTFDDLSKVAEDSCSQLVITSKTVFKGRIRVILVGENLGF